MNRHPNIRRDERGAVMVIGVFMSAFLVGCLWYIIGLGDAAVYRQYMQDGADATAYAAGVYQARGMNIIAMLNLIMASVLAVLVALKIAQVLLTIANVVSCALALIGIGIPFCTATTNAQPKLQQLIDKTTKIVHTVLKGLYIAESTVAVAMPFVAEVKSVMVAKGYAPTVDGGFMISISLIPGHVTKFLGDIGSKKDEPEATEPEQESKVVCKDDWVSSCACDKPKKNGCCSHHGGLSGGCRMVDAPEAPNENAPPDAGGGNPNEGIRWGLPVEDDEFSFLCGKAGEKVVELVFLPFEIIPPVAAFVEPIKDVVGGFVQTLTETFPGYFCGAGGVNVSGTLEGIGEDACKKAKEQAEKENESKPEEEREEFDEEKCKEGLTGGGGLGGLDMEGDDPGLMVPKKVYSDAMNGDNYFASWSFVWGDLKQNSDAAKGVDIAAWNNAKVGDPTFLSNYHFAKSEYYYEPKDDDPKDWEGLVEDAMWNMRWRARLRRTYLPPINLGSTIAGKFNEFVGGKLEPYIGTDNPVADKVMEIISGPTEALGTQLDDMIGEKVGNINQGIIH